MFLIHFSMKSNMLAPITTEDDALQQNSGIIMPSSYCTLTSGWWFFEEQLTYLYFLFYCKVAKPELMMPEQFIFCILTSALKCKYNSCWSGCCRVKCFLLNGEFFKFFFSNNKLRIDNMHYVALTNFLNICYVISYLSHQDNRWSKLASQPLSGQVLLILLSQNM